MTLGAMGYFVSDLVRKRHFAVFIVRQGFETVYLSATASIKDSLN